MHAVPPPMTGNYMPSGPDIEIDYSQFTYGPKQSQTSESETQTSDFDTCSDETHESLPEPAVNEPKVVTQPKGSRGKYSNARTPQQNEVAERKNRTLIEAARTMLAYSFLPNTFWAEVVCTACYVLNRVLVTKPHNKTPYELITGKGPTWLFDLDYLTDSMNYLPVRSENQANKHASPQEANHNAGTKDNIDAGDFKKEDKSAQDYFVLPIWSSYSSTVKRSTTKDVAEALRKEFAQEIENFLIQVGAAKASSTNIVNTVSTPVSTASPYDGLFLSDPTNPEQDDSEIPTLEDIYQNPTDGIFTNSSYDDEGAMADFTNLESVMNVSPIPTSRINSFHPSTLILGDPKSAVQTRHKILLDLPYGKKAIGTKWVYRNKKDERGVVVRNKASAFLYGKIDEEVYVSQPPGFLDPKYPQKNGYRRGTIDKTLFLKKDKHDIILVQVYVDDIIFGSTKKSWCDEFEALMKSRFQMSSMGELTFFLGLQVKQKADGIFISQDKYVAKILKKFDFINVKTASIPIETQKPLVKDEEASDVDVHLYRSMIGSLMYLTASRPDIMFAVCACSRFQVTPKTSHLSAVKRIFRYLKGKPKLGLWYPRVSSFDLEAYSDSDYAGANLDRKSTTGEAKYVATASCCGQVLWIQNQMLDYGFNFMNTKIYIDNESTICIVKNPVYYSKTKHIAIRHHFIRDAYEKKLIQVLVLGCFYWDDKSISCIRFRESLGRALDGNEALMLPKLFILWLASVSTDSAELVPMGTVSTAIETLKKNTAKALIFLSLTITHSKIMAILESCPKHNMVAYLEKTDGNAEFHEIIDFLTRSSIHHALTVSPVVSTTFVEQFWTSAKSKIINNVRHITAKVAGKPVSISEASIRSDLLFDDADGIDSLPNQAIFDAIQLMGYEGDLTVLTFNKALFSPQWSEKSIRNRGGLRDRVKIFSVATSEEHLTSENSHPCPCSNYWKDPEASLKFRVPHDWDPTVPSSYWAKLIRPVEPTNNESDEPVGHEGSLTGSN
ncbi:putative ribonuclease H-like domain-containing protein [Tanacetum coccineum]